MVRLYSGSGSGEVDLDDEAMSDEDWRRLRGVAIRLLHARGQNEASDLLTSIPFTLRNAHNGFGDEFSVLLWTAPMDRYIEAAEWTEDRSKRNVFEQIARTVTEVVPTYIRFVVVDLDTSEAPCIVATPSLGITSDVVERALRDAEQLIATTGATSGVDRLHTALHGYLKAACDRYSLTYSPAANIVALMKVIIKGHPAFTTTSTEAEKILRAFGVIVDALNPLRNSQSMAHPTATLLPEPEAMLAINTVRTILHYLNAKLI